MTGSVIVVSVSVKLLVVLYTHPVSVPLLMVKVIVPLIPGLKIPRLIPVIVTHVVLVPVVIASQDNIDRFSLVS